MKTVLILLFTLLLSVLLLPSCVPLTIGGAVIGVGSTAHTNDQIKKLKERVRKLESPKIKIDKRFKKPDGSYCLSVDPRC